MQTNPKKNEGRIRRPVPVVRLAPIFAACLVLASSLSAQVITVRTLGGGPRQGYPNAAGNIDGKTFTDSQFNTPSGLALDSTGNLFIADRSNGKIRKVTVPGDNALSRTSTFAAGLLQPVAVAIDTDNNVFVLTYGDGQIARYDSAGTFIGFVTFGLSSPTAMTIDLAGALYVTELGGNVSRITTNGVVTVLATGFNQPSGIAVLDDGSVAVSDTGNNAIMVIARVTGTVTTLAGGTGAGFADGAGTVAKFNQPAQLAKAPNGSLVLADRANNRVRNIQINGVTSTLYGVAPIFWNPVYYPGWQDGVGTDPDPALVANARSPIGVVVAPSSAIYVTETFYSILRQATGASLASSVVPLPPAPPPVIGVVNFPAPNFLSTLTPITDAAYNNDVLIQIKAEQGTQTYYTFGPTPPSPALDTIPSPSPTTGFSAPAYTDGMSRGSVGASLISTMPDVTVKAISVQDGRQSSPIVKARFQFKTANPTIIGDNAASFILTNITVGAEMWYTTDGSDPTNTAVNSTSTNFNGGNLSLQVGISNLTFKVVAFRPKYKTSDIVTKVFSATNFVANRLTFGFASGEASSDFIAAAGQTFLAPVTLQRLPGQKMYALQFSLTLSNMTGPPIAAGRMTFASGLLKPIPGTSPPLYTPIPPALFNGATYIDAKFTNFVSNLLGVGWFERQGSTNLYDATAQDLLQFPQHRGPMPSDNIVVGILSFGIPAGALSGQTYGIQISRPSAIDDANSGNSPNVVVAAPTNGTITASKTVTVGSRSYVVGDVMPFRWYNAGDFGDAALLNNDVFQVFQAAVYRIFTPLAGSDFFDAMDSSDGSSATVFDGNDTSINNIKFGDGILAVDDVYVTYRRSLDPSLTWYSRFWSNGVRQAVAVRNVYPFSNPSRPPLQLESQPPGSVFASGVEIGKPALTFTADDAIAGANRTLQVPIRAQITGGFPLRVLMMNVTVAPLDGSPALTQPVQFTSAASLGQPTFTSSLGGNNLAAAWLDSSVAGISGTNVVGTLVITLPASADARAAYAVHFDHVSASPNGLALFPMEMRDGLVTVASRDNSSWNDGIPDSWRLRYFGTVSNLLSDAQADADGDGISNWAEFKAGTNPLDAKSKLQLLIDGVRTNNLAGFKLRWPTVLNKRYVVESSTSLFGTNWTVVTTNVFGTGRIQEVTDTNPSTMKFYRVRLVE